MGTVLLVIGLWLLAGVLVALLAPRLFSAPMGGPPRNLRPASRMALGVVAAVGVALAAVGVTREGDPGRNHVANRESPAQDAYGQSAVRTLHSLP